MLRATYPKDRSFALEPLIDKTFTKINPIFLNTLMCMDFYVYLNTEADYYFDCCI